MEEHSHESNLSAASDLPSVSERVEELCFDIRGDEELLADIALNMYVRGESAVVEDKERNIATPEFSVKFMDAGSIGMTEEPDAEYAEEEQENMEHEEFEPAM